ncbi:hypothetical protein SLEP1_g58413 [Rubroshorea leprosula]|uniref:HAT C-terminal dimerisation domain-containing protein n=1 Tax=Rubroshorea leprosula TaxID=152421 RepID=A0AAV5MP72_9ROSI|nr:hypothetical protein SLEP1_g58413 [Rubroshorea leprosula]
MFNCLEDCRIGDDDLDEVELVEFNASGKRLLTAKSGAGMQGSGKKTKGLMDLFLMKPETIVQKRKESKMRQMSIKDSDPEARARTVQYIARFFYQAGIPFSVARLDSFKYMVEAIGRYGPNLKPPSYHELRVPLLKKELQLTNDMLEDRKKKWAKVHKQKLNLRKMFTSDEWMKSKFYKEVKGKRATDVILMPSFWNEIVYALKVMGPLVGVLRLVDNEKKPAMGYIYEAMDRAKEAIQKAFDGNEEKYKNVFSLIDKRWENQLHHPLHAAGHFLNPQFFYNDPSIATNKEIVKGLYDCIEKLIPNHDDQDKIIDQLHLYKEAEGMFADPMAVRSRSKRAPAQWWSSYGMETLELMSLAIRILSLTCSAAGCERNWSVFDKDEIDPISLDYIDDSNEWLIGKMGGDQDDAENELVFGDDDLTWGEVARASEIEEEEVDTEKSEEEIEDYHSSDGDDSSDDDEMNVVDEDDIDADDLS